MTQEEILISVLEPRSGYIRGKGTTFRGGHKGTQLEHHHLVNEQQKKIEEQEKRISELEERTTNQLEAVHLAMETMKQQFLRELDSRNSHATN